MTPAEGIRKLGFRRWYERQLIESHGFLVTGLLSLIAMVACLEQMSLRAPMKSLLVLATLIGGCAFACVWSLRRYQAILARAEYLGARSTCGDCGVYGALDIVQAGSAGGESGSWLKVRCRNCAHQWMIE